MKPKSQALTVQVEQLPPSTPTLSPEASARSIREAFVAGDPRRAGAFEKALLDAQARIAVHAYLVAIGAVK